MRDRLFLPETISEALDTDLATGLRAIADALDSGHLNGKHRGTMAAAGGLHDDRIHLKVTLDLAAPILQCDEDEVAELERLLGDSTTLKPSQETSREDLRLNGSASEREM